MLILRFLKNGQKMEIPVPWEVRERRDPELDDKMRGVMQSHGVYWQPAELLRNGQFVYTIMR